MSQKTSKIPVRKTDVPDSCGVCEKRGWASAEGRCFCTVTGTIVGLEYHSPDFHHSKDARPADCMYGGVVRQCDHFDISCHTECPHRVPHICKNKEYCCGIQSVYCKRVVIQEENLESQ